MSWPFLLLHLQTWCQDCIAENRDQGNRSQTLPILAGIGTIAFFHSKH